MSSPITKKNVARHSGRPLQRFSPIVVATAIILAATTFSGCIWAPELSRLRNDIERQLPGARFDKEFAITLGPISLAFAKLVTGFIPEARRARGYLKDLNHVQVAIYRVESMPPLKKITMPNQLKRMRERGWEIAIKVREESQLVWVMYRADDRAVREVLVVVLDDEELVMVKARGRLERIVGRALAESRGHRGIPNMEDVLGDGDGF